VHPPDAVAGLCLRVTATGDIELSFGGPMLVFPDTLPFVDLERGLASAAVAHAAVALRMSPLHEDGAAPCPFGTVAGSARIGEATIAVDGHGVRARRGPELGRATRVALRLADGTGVLASGDDGVVCRDGAHAPIRRCTVDSDGSIARIAIDGADGRRIALTSELVHHLPVVPGVPGAGRLLFSTLRDGERLAGWMQTPSG
jgi:hypothetical protein